MKIKIMTDSACDIPKEDEKALDIKILNFPITIGDVGYTERVDFTPHEFYNILMTSPTIPVTSQITQIGFLDAYNEVASQGYTELIYVPINSLGSNTMNSSLMARDEFYRKNPDGGLKIHIIDSRAYSMAYGYPVMESAKKVNKGADSAEIIAYLEDWFACVEVYCAPYTLEFMKKSGRVSCAAAFVGELIGLRPIISFIDGVTKVEEKVRGNNAIIPTLLKYAKEHAIPETPYILLESLLPEESAEFAEQLKKAFGYDAVGSYPLGAAITINAGPKVIAVIIKGERRKQK